ncbi:MAG TPA: amidohydrolase family protein [Mycobacteriales bacterium]|nr:amidohydrolase family protein [Mycobacteriales bacterium]
MIDAHCHSLTRDWTHVDAPAGPSWRRCFTEGDDPRVLAEVPALLGYRRFLAALADRLDAPRDEAALVSARDALARADPAGYLRRLLTDAGVERLLVDTGFDGPAALPLPDLARLAGLPVDEIVRIESVAEAVLRDGVDAARFADAVEERLEAAVAGGAVGFKSVAAYRVGLSLPAPSPGEARRAIDRLDRAAHGRRLADPVVVALVVWRAVAVAARHRLPLQFHTGFGDPDVTLPTADPALLTPLLRDRRAEGCPVVLLHCYPYVREAAYLAATYPDTYLDLSLTLPLAAPGAARLVAEALAMCPATRLIAASDGHSYPEMHWWGAVVWRRALSDALDREVAGLDPAAAVAVAAGVLGGNARRLHRLERSPAERGTLDA